MKIALKKVPAPAKKKVLVIASDDELDLEEVSLPKAAAPGKKRPIRVTSEEDDLPEKPSDKPTTYRCICGKVHKFNAFVLAHWDMRIKAECPECGATTNLIAGKVIKP